MAQRIKGILFDLGETLLDFGKVDVRGLFESGARLAYDYLAKLGQPLPTFAQYHRRQLWAIRRSVLFSRIIRREFNALDIIRRLAGRMGHELTQEQFSDLAWLWYEPLSRCATVEEGLGETLHRLQGEGIILGIISNTFIPSEVLDRHLEREGLLELFPIRVYSCDVRYRKPNRNIFTAALQQASLRADETMFVGDSLEADIQGANRAGLISVLKDPIGRHAKASIRPRHRISRLAELVQLVDQYNHAPKDKT